MCFLEKLCLPDKNKSPCDVTKWNTPWLRPLKDCLGVFSPYKRFQCPTELPEKTSISSPGVWLIWHKCTKCFDLSSLKKYLLVADPAPLCPSFIRNRFQVKAEWNIHALVCVVPNVAMERWSAKTWNLAPAKLKTCISPLFSQRKLKKSQSPLSGEKWRRPLIPLPALEVVESLAMNDSFKRRSSSSLVGASCH